MLVVFGSVAIDTIRTPSRVRRNVLGGAAVYASLSASFFTKPGLVGVVGSDFGAKSYQILKKHLDLRGLEIMEGKTFRYDGMYDKTLTFRKTLKTELNVLGKFRPEIPDDYRKAGFVYLANNDPDQNIRIIRDFDSVKFSMCDTIDFWIATKRASVIKMIKSVDAIVINDEEAKLLTKEHNLIKCAKKMMGWGVRYVIIKKGEHGSLMFLDDTVFASPSFSLEDVLDPTGAGDSFAGAMMGYLDSRNSASLSAIKKAVAYGNVMGSFTVERYGLDGLLQLTRRDISRRMRLYEKMLRF